MCQRICTLQTSSDATISNGQKHSTRTHTDTHSTHQQATERTRREKGIAAHEKKSHALSQSNSLITLMQRENQGVEESASESRAGQHLKLAPMSDIYYYYYNVGGVLFARRGQVAPTNKLPSDTLISPLFNRHIVRPTVALGLSSKKGGLRQLLLQLQRKLF